MKQKWTEEYWKLNDEHTAAVKEQNWEKTAKIFARMMKLTDLLHGPRGS